MWWKGNNKDRVQKEGDNIKIAGKIAFEKYVFLGRPTG